MNEAIHGQEGKAQREKHTHLREAQKKLGTAVALAQSSNAIALSTHSRESPTGSDQRAPPLELRVCRAQVTAAREARKARERMSWWPVCPPALYH